MNSVIVGSWLLPIRMWADLGRPWRPPLNPELWSAPGGRLTLGRAEGKVGLGTLNWTSGCASVDAERGIRDSRPTCQPAPVFPPHSGKNSAVPLLPSGLLRKEWVVVFINGAP